MNAEEATFDVNERSNLEIWQEVADISRLKSVKSN